MMADRASYIWYFIRVLLGASTITLFLPLFVWKNYLKDKSPSHRFVFVLLTQNVLLINLVLLLGFFKICNGFTVLVGLTSFYVLVNRHYSRGRSLYGVKNIWDQLSLLAKGKKQFFTLRRELFQWFLKKYGEMKKWPLWQHIRKNLVEYVFLVIIVIYNGWFLSYNVLEIHSYQFSDIPVHQRWVHGLGEGNIFIDGIYPFGMHIIVYFIHKLFLIDLREVLIYFGIFQTIILVLSIHLLGRSLFPWKYGAFIGTIIFTLTMKQGRYGASLPQECGVFASVLAAWCLLRFLKRTLGAQRIKTDSKLKGLFRIKPYLRSSYFKDELFLFSLAVSLTIAYHFYTAIGAFMLVFSLAVAFLFKVVKKQYWVPILGAGLVGVLLGTGPLMAFYAKGVPFQESMAWAMSVIRGEEWLGTDTDYRDELESMLFEEGQNGGEVLKGEVKPSPEGIRPYLEGPYNFYRVVVLDGERAKIFLFCMASGIVFALILLITRTHVPTGAGYVALILYMAIMGLMGAAQELGMVEIIGATRAMSFSEPFAGLIFALPLNFIFMFLEGRGERAGRRIFTAGSLVVCLGIVYLIFKQNWVHDFFDVNPAYYNEPDILVKEIRKEYKPWTYTIVSTGEEYYQVLDYGYHVNISKFVNMVGGNEEEFKILSPYVFFFIEKRVFQDFYYGRVDVSRELAQKDFVYFESSQDYYFQRAVLESKAYYWALEFKKLYPNSFKVYFENEVYIVYILEQNPYNLYNLQIDFLPEGVY